MHAEMTRDARWFVQSTINNALDGPEPFRAAALSDDDLGLPEYRATAERFIGRGRCCFVGVRVRLGVRSP